MRMRPGAANYIRHIPDTGARGGKTFCGKVCAIVNCIDPKNEANDVAECAACQRVAAARGAIEKV